MRRPSSHHHFSNDPQLSETPHRRVAGIMPAIIPVRGFQNTCAGPGTWQRANVSHWGIWPTSVGSLTEAFTTNE